MDRSSREGHTLIFRRAKRRDPVKTRTNHLWAWTVIEDAGGVALARAYGCWVAQGAGVYKAFGLTLTAKREGVGVRLCVGDIGVSHLRCSLNLSKGDTVDMGVVDMRFQQAPSELDWHETDEEKGNDQT